MILKFQKHFFCTEKKKQQSVDVKNDIAPDQSAAETQMKKKKSSISSSCEEARVRIVLLGKLLGGYRYLHISIRMSLHKCKTRSHHIHPASSKWY